MSPILDALPGLDKEERQRLVRLVDNDNEEATAAIDAVAERVGKWLGDVRLAPLALAAATAGSGVTRVVLFEPPCLGEVEDGARLERYTERLRDLLAAGRRGDAVALFMTTVGLPAQVIAGIRAQPGWAAMEAIDPMLAYDDELLAGGRVPRDLASAVAVPSLVVSGGASPQGLRLAAKATAEALPHAEHRVLDGQTHDVDPQALVPVLTDIFKS